MAMNMPLDLIVDHSETMDPRAGKVTEIATPSKSRIKNTG